MADDDLNRDSGSNSQQEGIGVGLCCHRDYAELPVDWAAHVPFGLLGPSFSGCGKLTKFVLRLHG